MISVSIKAKDPSGTEFDLSLMFKFTALPTSQEVLVTLGTHMDYVVSRSELVAVLDLLKGEKDE